MSEDKQQNRERKPAFSPYRFLARIFVLANIKAHGGIPADEIARRNIVQDAFDLADAYMDEARKRTKRYYGDRDSGQRTSVEGFEELLEGEHGEHDEDNSGD